MHELLIYDLEHTFVGADLHLGHRGIIPKCRHRFCNVQEMNETIIKNWNEMVRPQDIVYHLGDLCLGRRNGGPLSWLERLNGQKVLIAGNHDRRIPSHLMTPYETIQVNEFKFFLVHNPHDAPADWDGWVIHGHNHRFRPFLDVKNKRINVSAEQTLYRPVSLAFLINLIKGLGTNNGECNQRKTLKTVPPGHVSSPSPIKEHYLETGRN
jgi:calcineurin-like phosphoesterase family protein